jgi:4-carboxymuconolactone decarboxylase
LSRGDRNDSESEQERPEVQVPDEETKAVVDAYAAVPKLRELREQVLFGDIWERTELSKRDRSLITIAALITMRAGGELRVHIGRGLENGLTRSEISEVITQLAFYAGWPAGVNGSLMASEAFAAAPEEQQ